MMNGCLLREEPVAQFFAFTPQEWTAAQEMADQSPIAFAQGNGLTYTVAASEASVPMFTTKV